MKDFSIIFKELVNEIDNSISFDSAVISGSEVTFTSSNTKWLRLGKIISGKDVSNNVIEGRITAISKDVSFTLDNIEIVKEITAPKPFVITGTKMAVNIEWTKASNFAKEKTPISWLLDSYTETEFGRESSVERDIVAKIFFLDETDIKNYYTEDHKEQVVDPMTVLKDMFLSVISKKPIFKAYNDVNVRFFTKFGTENENGYIKNIIDANLSGILLEITLTKYKDAKNINFCR